MIAFDAGDVSESVVEHVIMQGDRIHLVNNWSTDGTIDRL